MIRGLFSQAGHVRTFINRPCRAAHRGGVRSGPVRSRCATLRRGPERSEPSAGWRMAAVCCSGRAGATGGYGRCAAAASPTVDRSCPVSGDRHRELGAPVCRSGRHQIHTDCLCNRRDPVDIRLVINLESAKTPEWDDFSLNRHPTPSFCWSMIFSEKPVNTRDHAPGARPAWTPPEPPTRLIMNTKTRVAGECRPTSSHLTHIYFHSFLYTQVSHLSPPTF